MQHLLKPLVVSWGYESDTPSGSQFVDYHEWWGTRDIAAFLSVPEAIRFQQSHDWQSVRNECHDLLGEILRDVEQIAGLRSFYPDHSWYAQVATAPLPGATDLVKLKSRLYDEYAIEVPLMEWKGHKLMRVSIQGYNSRRDAERLHEALIHLL